jgi:hypothetical protein
MMCVIDLKALELLVMGLIQVLAFIKYIIFGSNTEQKKQNCIDYPIILNAFFFYSGTIAFSCR